MLHFPKLNEPISVLDRIFMQRIEHVKHRHSFYPGHLEVKLERSRFPTARAEDIRQGATVLYHSACRAASHAVERVTLRVRNACGPENLAKLAQENGGLVASEDFLPGGRMRADSGPYRTRWAQAFLDMQRKTW